MRKTVIIFLILVAVVFCAADREVNAADPLMVFCGAAFKKPMEEITGIYEKQTGMRPDVVYAGVGTLFSQILLSKQGDVFVVPSPDIMAKAQAKGVIKSGSVKDIAYVVPCINTLKGNPKNIRSLGDLARPGIRVGLANPEIVYIGAIAVEIIEKNLSADEKKALRGNIATYVEDFNKLATLLVLKQVDAIIGMHFLEGWYPEKVSTVKLKPNEVSRIGNAQAAVITYTVKKDEAARFIEFLASREAQVIFRKYHYFGTVREAFSWVGAVRPVGGEFTAMKERGGK